MTRRFAGRFARRLAGRLGRLDELNEFFNHFLRLFEHFLDGFSLGCGSRLGCSSRLGSSTCLGSSLDSLGNNLLDSSLLYGGLLRTRDNYQLVSQSESTNAPLTSCSITSPGSAYEMTLVLRAVCLLGAAGAAVFLGLATSATTSSSIVLILAGVFLTGFATMIRLVANECAYPCEQPSLRESCEPSFWDSLRLLRQQ